MSDIKLSEIRAELKSGEPLVLCEKHYGTVIPHLLELVKRLGKVMAQIRDITGHTYDCPEGLTEARILRHISTATEPCSELCKEARTLLKELEL